MTLLSFVSWAGMTAGVSMTLLFLGVFIHVALGNRNTWLLSVVAMLFLSNVALSITSYIDFTLLDQANVSFININVQSTAWGVSDGFFSLAHFFLAFKY